jgi:hypothetical protein
MNMRIWSRETANGVAGVPTTGMGFSYRMYVRSRAPMHWAIFAAAEPVLMICSAW